MLPSSLASRFWKADGRHLRFGMGAGPLSLRSPLAMARRPVRRSVRTKSRTEQVAEPRSDLAMRLHPSLSKGDHPPSLTSLLSSIPCHRDCSVSQDGRGFLRRIGYSSNPANMAIRTVRTGLRSNPDRRDWRLTCRGSYPAGHKVLALPWRTVWSPMYC